MIDGRRRQKCCWQCQRPFVTPDGFRNWCSAACETEYLKNPIDYATSDLFSGSISHRLVRSRRAEVGQGASTAGLSQIRDTETGFLKEVLRRYELRQRLEAERGEPISDKEFLRLAEQTGGIEL